MSVVGNKVDKDVYEYFLEENLDKYITDEEKVKLQYEYDINDPYYTINNESKEPFPLDIYDIVRLHKLIRKRKCFTVLEFGIGYSTIFIADALLKNKRDFESLENKPNLRINNSFEVHSIDNEKEWVEYLNKKLEGEKYLELKDNIKLHYSEIKIGTFNDRICSYYEKLPDIVPDFIYLVGPSTSNIQGDINGLTFNRCIDRTVLSGDILLMEPCFEPGTFILIDGRTNNKYFLENNLQRKYDIYHNQNKDVSTLELIDDPLGKWNRNKLEYCLNKIYS